MIPKRSSLGVRRAGSRGDARTRSITYETAGVSGAKGDTRDMNGDLSILLVDDGAADTALTWSVAAHGAPNGLRITHATSMNDALRLRQECAFDLLLLVLDPACPHCNAILEQLADVAGQLPVVLLTTRPDAALSARALALGVQDHLVSGEDRNAALARSLRHAVIRQRLRPAPHTTETGPISTSTALDGWLGRANMKATLPHVFQDLVASVTELLTLAPARSPDDDVAGRLAPQLLTLAARLAMLTAAPSDVAEIVRAAQHRGAARAGGLDEARAAPLGDLVLIGLIAALCEQYKRDALDGPRRRDNSLSNAG